MTQSVDRVVLPPAFGDHTQLPESDGTFVKNFQEHPQSLILTDSIGPILQQRHPDGQYAIGQDCGIYWRETEPAEKGAEAPDWFYVPNVPPNLDGQIRRSYVLWREHIAPLIALEFASGNGDEERDSTPLSRTDEGLLTKPGKFWVYEQVMRIPYYGIYEINSGRLEVYRLIDGYYRLLELNERGHFAIVLLGVELGLWQGSYQNQEMLWLRWWDEEGNLLLIGDERAELERLRGEQQREIAECAEQARQQAEQARQAEFQARRAAIPRLLGMGLSAEQVAEALGLSVEEVAEDA
ncbi:Uma2 family endonuclease [Lyngbya sp. CCAP 1446/10]|uniref:Uma2 family endonuclease n=1 Tax=Lyngbya sp. CCAP 1446/10 TaxID=439293 RepID=UPI002237853E|nr:Uma2 family endonuclease [Lyngbya sp. CCAP 1446/10]MCW6051556.1 Uma2 family endonuclease [Lyngbya sp. CCAP 1446/10]